ncbi:hypothetical protein M231_06109 [Tremella mesenterica]|uniref:Uncharacterized protein n=1 Tax=Tremella mesenterica TaxID=5217 RepID=A0A4Q1BEE6_TREME|nr:hypothetical protein M231_06109 [Tremella mesenterica]
MNTIIEVNENFNPNANPETVTHQTNTLLKSSNVNSSRRYCAQTVQWGTRIYEPAFQDDYQVWELGYSSQYDSVGANVSNYYAGSMRAIGKHARKLWMWARQQAEVPSKHHYIEFTTVLPTNASEAQRREAIMKHGVYNLATQLTSFSNALVGTEEGRLHKGLGGMGRSALNFLFSRT